MNSEIQFILYHLPDEEGKVQVVIKDETILATQKAMAQLFGVDIPAISKHLTHIFDEGELDKYTTVSIMEITTQHGAIEGNVKLGMTGTWYVSYHLLGWCLLFDSPMDLPSALRMISLRG